VGRPLKVEVTLRLTASQSVSQSVSLRVEPHLGLMTRYLLLFDSYGLVFVGILSDERTGLSFVYAAGPCQRSLSQVRASRDSRAYFTASDLGLHFPSPPTTRRVTVEVFDPASTRVLSRNRAELSSSLLPATSQHGHSWQGPMAIYLFSDSLVSRAEQ
jgi:hypothetical protein